MRSGARTRTAPGGAWAVRELQSVDSTQAEVARLARAGAPEGTVVSALHQTAGRGRWSRRWWDAPEESLLVSVLLRPAVPPARAPQLTLVAAVAVVDAVREAAGVTAAIRWPNDVMAGGRKLCGILAEASSGADGRLEHVVLGIGINVNQTAFPPDIEALATSLCLVTGARHDRRAVLAALLAALRRWYGVYLAEGLGPVREAWRRASLTLGERVTSPGARAGLAVDLDEDGALLVQADDGTLQRLSSGEVTSAAAP